MNIPRFFRGIRCVIPKGEVNLHKGRLKVGFPGHQLDPSLIWLLIGFLGVIATYGPHLGHSTDDSFITYRYASNLSHGMGLVFNQGVHHLGTTAPGWAVIAGFVAFVTGSTSIPVVSGFLSLAALFASIGLLSQWINPENFHRTFGVALVLACNRWTVEVLGHEGFAVAFFMMLSLYLSAKKRHGCAGATWGLAFFVRPDSALMGAVSGLLTWIRARKIPLRILLGFLVVSCIAVVIIKFLAGSVIPASLDVKRAEGTNQLLAVGAQYWQALALWFQRTMSWGTFPLVALGGWGWVRTMRKRPWASVEFLLPVLSITVFYPLVGVPFAPWYFIVPLVGVFVGSAVAVSDSIGSKSPLRIVVASTLAILSILPTAIWSIRTGVLPPDPRKTPMESAARWVQSHSQGVTTAATVEVGFFGFAFEGSVLDIMGLGSPGSLQALTSAKQAEFFLDQSPEYLVENPTFAHILSPIIENPGFKSQYRKVHTIPATEQYPRPIHIWHRIASPDGGADSAATNQRGHDGRREPQ